MTWPSEHNVRRIHAVIDGLPWLLVSNGYVGIVEQRELRQGEEFPDAIDITAIVRAIKNGNAVAVAGSLDVLRVPPEPNPPPCTKCNGMLEVACPDCAGSLRVACECDCGDQHEADCEECDNGVTACDCVDAIADTAERIPASIAGVSGIYDRRLITLALDELPTGDVTRIGNVDAVDNFDCLMIERGGAYGIVVAMSTNAVKNIPTIRSRHGGHAMNAQSAIVTHGSCDRCEGVGDIMEMVVGWVNRRTYLCVPCWRLLVNIGSASWTP